MNNSSELNTVKKISTEVCVSTFLEKIVGIEDGPMTMILDLFGGRTKVIAILIDYFKEDIKSLEDRQVYDSFKQILFYCSGNETYSQDWEILWDKINLLPLPVIVRLLEEHAPRKRNEHSADASLNYLLSNRYNLLSLTKECYEELKDLFDFEPEEFKAFRKKQNFIDKVLLFEDTSFIYNSYSELSFKRIEILELLKQVVICKKIDTNEKLSIFLNLVRFYAPTNSFDRKYRDAFILEIFEGNDACEINSWDEQQLSLWYEEFPNIDFIYSSSYDIKDRIDNSCSEEAKHITEHLQNNQNYRHD